MTSEPFITVVSGLPRSGTSMMMQMLVAAGFEALTDDARPPDPDNPLGYFEFEAVKKTRENAGWLESAKGKVVKVVHILLQDLPPTYLYRIVMMHRDLDEVVASQRKMLERLGRPGASLPPDKLKQVFASQLDAARKAVAARPNCQCLDVHFREVVEEPVRLAGEVAAFIGRPGMAKQMSAAVQASLYRNRADSIRSGRPSTT